MSIEELMDKMYKFKNDSFDFEFFSSFAFPEHSRQESTPMNTNTKLWAQRMNTNSEHKQWTQTVNTNNGHTNNEHKQWKKQWTQTMDRNNQEPMKTDNNQ